MLSLLPDFADPMRLCALGKAYEGAIPLADLSRLAPLLTSTEREAAFVEQAKAAGLTSLKGHRSVGGIRTSIYNAMPLEGVVALKQFMIDFQQQNA